MVEKTYFRYGDEKKRIMTFLAITVTNTSFHGIDINQLSEYDGTRVSDAQPWQYMTKRGLYRVVDTHYS